MRIKGNGQIGKRKYNYDTKEPQEIFQDILDEKISRFPTGYWKQPGIETECAIITRYFIEKVLKWEDRDIKEKICEMIFRKYHLSGMLEYVFGRSPYLALDNAYPGRYKVWDLKCTPKRFWVKEENRNEALNFLLDQTGKVKINELTNKDFLKYNLGGLMDYLTANSVYKTLNTDLIEQNRQRKWIYTKISFSVTNKKSGRNKVRARLEIPEEMLEEIGVTKENNDISISLKNDTIIIKKQI